MKCEFGEKPVAEAEPGCRPPFAAVINTDEVLPVNATNHLASTLAFHGRRSSPGMYDGLPRPSTQLRWYLKNVDSTRDGLGRPSYELLQP